MNSNREDWIQSIYKTPTLDGEIFSRFVGSFSFCMVGRTICVDMVQGPILNELLMDDGYPYFRPEEFLRIIRKRVAVEWMDVYISGSPLIFSHESNYEEVLPKADMLIRAVDGGYIYTYVNCAFGAAKVQVGNFEVVEVARGGVSSLSFPG